MRASADPAAERPDLRLVPPALAVWLVCWLGRRLPTGVLLGSAAALAVVGALAALSRRRWSAAVAATAALSAAAALAGGLVVSARADGTVAALAVDRAAATLVGRLTDDPRRAQRPTAQGSELVVVRLDLEQVTARGATYRLRTPALVLTTDQGWLRLLPSQRVRLDGRLLPAGRGDDVAVLVSGRGPPQVLSAASAVQRAAGRLRGGLQRAVAPLPDAEGGLLPGLVVGDTSRLSDDVRADFRTVGLTHLTAVSGTNVSIVLGAVLLVCARLGVRLRARPVVAAVALAGFVVLARPDPSVLRASAMGAVGLLALGTGTRRAAVPALCAAVVVLVLAAPDLAAAPGFALSVLATAGLLLLAPPWTAALSRRLPVAVAAALAVPAAAAVATGPVVVALSSQVGLLTVPANLLAAPAVAPATVLGLLAAVTAPVALPVGQLFAWAAWLPAAWLVLVARTGAAVPGATVGWPDGAAGAAWLAALTAVLLPVLAVPRLRRPLLAAATGLAVAVAGLQAVRPAWPPPGWFAVVCDVGQGDAVALAAGAESAVVVDAGPDPRAVDGCLRRLGVSTVPVVVLTHPHADHVLGLPGVLRGRRVGLVQTGPKDDPAQQAARVREWAAGAGVPLGRPGLGEVRRVGPLRWEVLAPLRAYRGTRSDPNNASLVLRVDVGPTRLLLTGDVEPEGQRDLLRGGADLRADVLKVPHHGSAQQDLALLDAVGARVGVTSVGAGNSYGHPSAGTLAALTAGGAASFRTDLQGDVALVHRGGQLVVVPRKGGGSGAAQAGDQQPGVGPWAGAAGRRAGPVDPRRGGGGAARLARGLAGGAGGPGGAGRRRGARPGLRRSPARRRRRRAQPVAVRGPPRRDPAVGAGPAQGPRRVGRRGRG